MSQFHTRSFNSRLGAMGDQAEAVFDEVNPAHHKLGLNRPPFQVGGMLVGMRYLPDRMVRDRFVEVMGCGRDRTLKVKNEKMMALTLWSQIGPVDLFVYDSHKDRWYQASLDDWYLSLRHHGIADTFHDGKEYVGLHVDHFPSVPHERLSGDASRVSQ